MDQAFVGNEIADRIAYVAGTTVRDRHLGKYELSIEYSEPGNHLIPEEETSVPTKRTTVQG